MTNLNFADLRLVGQTPNHFAQEVEMTFSHASAPLRAVMGLAAGQSPYMRQLIQSEGAWLVAQSEDIEAGLAQVETDVRAASVSDVKTILRQAKRRVALLLGIADLADVLDVMEITRHLTQFADLCVVRAFEAALDPLLRRGKIPQKSIEDLPNLAGVFILAMGKMGAYELNYSSDIDLICLFDETQFDYDNILEARAQFVKATRTASAILSDKTADGYVFRTDLRLRPDPSVTPVCMAAGAAMTYYESLGRAWERAAFIKARVCAGDHAAGARFLEGLRPFVWRRHLDFAAVEDAHAMRLRIRENKGFHGAIVPRGHHVKLGRGGIREIEFFAQTNQLIAGGRDPDLRPSATLAALDHLAQKGWVPEETAQELSAHYKAHRQLEHRIQMIHDAQTHIVPSSDEEMARLAALMGTTPDALEADIRARFDQVHRLIESFFAPDPTAQTVADPFSNEMTSQWRSYPAMRSERAVQVFTRLWPKLKSRLEESPNSEETMRALDVFLSNLPAGVQLFSLLEANPALLDLLCDILSSSQELAQYMSRNAQVFDAVIAGEFFAPWEGVDALHAEFSARINREADYEARLDTLRIAMKEASFRVGVLLLKNIMTPDEAMAAYSDIAEAILRTLWPEVQAQFAAKHGPAPGLGAAIVAMGSLGARRLHARSDLDLIVIYDAQGQDSSQGPRPLDTRMYYARLTKALITALTAQTARGRLYEVDMRLRPSGNKGPVATSLSSFQSYQADDAWTWEHLALTRARVVATPEPLCASVTAALDAVMAQPRERGKVLADMLDMRARIYEAKHSSSPWDLKYQEGSLQDLELLGQVGALLAGERTGDLQVGLGHLAGVIGADQVVGLQSAAQLCGDLHVATKLLTGTPPEDTMGFSVGGLAMVSAVGGQKPLEVVQNSIHEARQRTQRALTALELQAVSEDSHDGTL